MRRARSLKDQAPVKAAVIAQIAVAIAILTVAPVRASNLAAIRLGENLVKPGGPDTPYLLVFPDYDVKNRVDLTFELDEYVTAVIDEYVHDFRPAVMRGSNQDLAIPGDGWWIKGCASVRHPDHRARSKGDRVAHYVTSISTCRSRSLPEAPSRRLRDTSSLPGSSQYQDHGEVLLRPGDYSATRMLGDVVRQHRKNETDPDETGDWP